MTKGTGAALQAEHAGIADLFGDLFGLTSMQQTFEQLLPTVGFRDVLAALVPSADMRQIHASLVDAFVSDSVVGNPLAEWVTPDRHLLEAVPGFVLTKSFEKQLQEFVWPMEPQIHEAVQSMFRRQVAALPPTMAWADVLTSRSFLEGLFNDVGLKTAEPVAEAAAVHAAIQELDEPAKAAWTRGARLALAALVFQLLTLAVMLWSLNVDYARTDALREQTEALLRYAASIERLIEILSE